MLADLLILGASARAAAFSALRAGYRPVAGDLFADEDLRGRCWAERMPDYPAGLSEFARRWPGIPWMYTGGLENRPALVDEISDGRTLWGNHGRLLRQVRDPWLVARAAKKAGLATPLLARDGSRLPAGDVWLSKPRASCGGAGIHVYTSQGKADGDKARGDRRYLQRRVAGVPCGAVYVAVGGESRLLGVTRQIVGPQWTGAEPFQYAGSIGPVRLSPGCEAQLHRFGKCLAGGFGIRGLFGIDVTLDGDRVWLLEVNPRYVASIEILERAWSIQSIALHAAAFSESRLPETHRTAGTNTACCGKAIVYAAEDVKVDSQFVDRAVSRNAARWPTYADIPRTGTQIRAGQPVLTVFADAEDADLVEQSLRDRVREVRDWLSGVL